MIKQTQIDHEQTNKTKIDWSEIKSRVNALQESLHQKTILSPEERRSLLKARAQALAVEKKDEAVQQELIEVVVFGLASETYGIETAFVREVYPLKDFTSLPGTPLFVLGIVNVRGQILSVIDLKKFFNLPTSGLGELNKVIILHDEKMEFGILADIILGVHIIPVDTIQSSMSTITGIGTEYLKGVTGERLIVLDAEKILCDPKIIVHQEAE
jgi:purine-binding chemotaxis protein CheW